MKKTKKTNPVKQKTVPVKHPAGWFLMAGADIGVREIKNIFPPESDIEIWPEAGVLEIVISEKMSMDIEETELPDDPESRAYFTERGISRIFYISFRDEVYEAAYALMRKMVRELPVTICADTDDLKPVVEG